MHLRTPDDEMTQDQTQNSKTDIENKTQLPHKKSDKLATSEKEPRQVYISLRDSSGLVTSGPIFGNFFFVWEMLCMF